ncbi:MAG: hypothetical protein ACXWEY_05515 [Bacteroidia bacterium]
MKPISNNNSAIRTKSVCLGILLLFAYMLVPKNAVAQNCASTVPSYTLDFTGTPDTTWVSPSVSRSGLCCSKSGSTDCILFYVTLDTNAIGVSVNAVGGLGNTDYEIKCKNPTPLGTSTCIYNTGSFYVTICKPGGNAQQYTITSIPRPHTPSQKYYISPNGCSANLEVKGVVPSSVTWKSISGSTYNSNLSCSSGCLTTVVSRTSNFPAYVDYQVCGVPSSSCIASTFCDTVRVYNVNALTVNISPAAAYICTGNTTTGVIANVTGGIRPYSYSWSGGQTDSSVNLGTGTHIVTVTDIIGCQIGKDTVIVTSATKPTPTIVGSSIICVYEEGTYFVNPQSNRTYSWSVSGGIITSGDSTNMINVIWSATGTKTVTVTETNTITGCFATASKSVTAHPKPTIDSIDH